MLVPAEQFLGTSDSSKKGLSSSRTHIKDVAAGLTPDVSAAYDRDSKRAPTGACALIACTRNICFVAFPLVMKISAFCIPLLVSFSLSNPLAGATFTIADGDVAGLKSAFAAASSNAQNDTINLATNGTYTLTTVDNATGDNGPNGLPELGEAGFGLTVNGNGATIQRSTASGTPTFRLIYVAGNATVNNLNLVNGTTSGGAFYNADGTLTLGGCTFTGNAAEDGVSHGAAGGAIYNIGGTTNVSNCTFSQNTANNARQWHRRGAGRSRHL